MQTYSYDATGQLSAVAASGGTTSYGYDVGGNRTSAGSQTATYTTANRLVATGSGGLGYTEDAAGSVTQAKGADPGAVEAGHYLAERAGYDLDGRLTWVERVAGYQDLGGGGGPGDEPPDDPPGGSSRTSGVGTDSVGGGLDETTTLRVEYQYDAWGNMVGRSVTEYTGGTAGTPAVEKYAVDGWEVAQDFWGQRPGRVANEAVDKWADVTAGGTLLARRVSGDGVDDLVAGYSSTLPGGHVWYLQDRLGSVVGEASGAGGNSTASYGAWGAVASGSVLADRYGWTGREHDAAAGLIDLRDRHYEAATGRFWQEDPSGLSAGDSNLYRFAGNSPTNGTDPSGHEWVSWDGFKRGMGFLGNGAAMIVTAPKDAAAALAGAVLLSDTNVPTNEMLAIVRDRDGSLRTNAVVGGQDGVVFVANGIMGGWHEGVRKEAERLKATEGGVYAASEESGAIAKNAAVMAVTAGASGALAKGGSAAAKWVAGVTGMSTTTTSAIASVAHVSAVGATAYELGQNAARAGQGIGQIVNGVRDGDVQAVATGVVTTVASGLNVAAGWAVVQEVGQAAQRGWQGLTDLFGHCFPAGTELATTTGPRAIERVAVGDGVWAYDLEAGAWVAARVTATYERQSAGRLAVLTAGGEEVRSTLRHPYWVARGEGLAERPAVDHLPARAWAAAGGGRWVYAEDVQEGDVLLSHARGEVVVAGLVLEEFAGPVYNCEVEWLHCYAVGPLGVLAHNGNPTDPKTSDTPDASGPKPGDATAPAGPKPGEGPAGGPKVGDAAGTGAAGPKPGETPTVRVPGKPPVHTPVPITGGHTSGPTKPPTTGAPPNSVYSWTDPKTGAVKQNWIYDSNGKVVYQVDFSNHGVGSPSGHGHPIPTPGRPDSGHTHDYIPVPHADLPPGYGDLPPGLQPRTPIGK